MFYPSLSRSQKSYTPLALASKTFYESFCQVNTEAAVTVQTVSQKTQLEQSQQKNHLLKQF